MTYLNDTMRVEISLPVHIMLSVLLSGANCADPGPKPHGEPWHPHYQRELDMWSQAKSRHAKRIQEDPQFAKSYEVFKQTRAWLMEACQEALKGLFPQRKEISVLRRIERLHHEIVEPFLKGENTDPRKIGIIAFYLLQHLVETGILIVPEDSSFGKALEHMLPALSPWENSSDREVADYENLNRSARKQVKKIIQNLQQAGYYKGIPLPDY